VIEIDGDSHSTQEMYDLKRTNYLESRNLKIIRFTNRDVLYNIEGVEQVIHQEIINLTQ